MALMAHRSSFMSHTLSDSDVMVAFRGEPGSYSEAAARQLFGMALGEAAGDVGYLGRRQLSDVFTAVEKGAAMYALVPVENTLCGSVHASYDLMLKFPDLHVICELDFAIEHCLVAAPGVTKGDIRLIISQWEALEQCDGYLKAWGVEKQSLHDTAASAKMIRDQGLCDVAAICSELAAKTYGLEVLQKGIQDLQFNSTRFLLLSREPCVAAPERSSERMLDMMGKTTTSDSISRTSTLRSAKVKTTVIFWLPDTKGVFFKAASAFSMRGLEIIRTESGPVSDSLAQEIDASLVGQGYCQFYIDIAGQPGDESMQDALEHLRELSDHVRVLGPYPTGGALTSDVVSRTEDALPRRMVPTMTVKARRGGLRIGIVGFGRFGQFLAKMLVEDHDIFVTAIEPGLQELADEMNCTWIAWEDFGNQMLLRHRVDVLVMSTSMMAFPEVLSLLPTPTLQQARPLVVDVLSVKAYPKELMTEQLPQECDILCTHPMFGPASGSGGCSGLPFVFEVVRAQQQARTDRFLASFEQAGCRMVGLSCEEHDKMTAPSYFLTQLTGRVLAKHGCDPTPIDTVGYQHLRGVADHVVKDTWEVFYGLFRFNPNALEQLTALKDGMIETERQLKERASAEAAGKPEAIRMQLSSIVGKISDPCTSQGLHRKVGGQDDCKVNSALSRSGLACPPPAVVTKAVAALARAGNKSCSAELRRAICEDLRSRRGIEYKLSEVVVAGGIEQTLQQALRAICDEGDEVLVPTPSRAGVFDTVKLCGGRPVALETRVEQGFMLRPGDLKAALEKCGKRCRALLLCNPSSPAGAVMPLANMAGLAEVLQRPEFQHVYVIADETYERISFGGPLACFAALPNMKRRTLLVSGLSDVFAMPGMRLSWLATAHEGVTAAAAKLQGTIIPDASVIAQRAALAVLQGGAEVEAWCGARAKELREKREMVREWLREVPEVRCPTPDAGFYALVDMSRLFSQRGARATSAEEFCELLMKEHQVEATSGNAAYAPGCVRLSLCAGKDDLDDALDALVTCARTVLVSDGCE